MASTFLDDKISSFIEDKFPEFVQSDHPVFVQFLREYYKFLEAAKLTLTDVLQTDQILLENKLTTNYLANEFDGSRFVYENSTYGAFQKDEIVTGQTSGATATILAEDNSNAILYIEANRYFQVGEIIVGGTSGARATIGKYQGNPVQTIQQLLEYVDVDNTISDFLDHFRESYLTAIPNTLATGVSKRKLVKSVRDLYRAKGTRKGHETFFRLMFDETPELTYPTENILKISAGDWSSDTVLRIVATENDPNNLLGQVVTQTVDEANNIEVASASVESVLQLQEGETTVYQLILNVASIDGTFVSGAEVTGIDNSDADTSIAGTVQPILIGATVTEGSAGYTTDDTVTITSATGQNALISIVDVGSGEIEQVIIDNPGSNYSVGDPLFFDNTNTEGSGASAIVSCIGGAIQPELGDSTDRTITGNVSINSSTITNITTTTLYPARQFIIGGNVTSGSASITNINTKHLVVEAKISGTGIPANAFISSIDITGEYGSITISANATQTGTNVLLTHLEEGTGQRITGTKIPTGSRIRTIVTAGASNNGTITIDKNATANGSGETLTIPSEYGMETFDHVVYEEGTEITDAYTGNQIMYETDTWATLGVTAEKGEVVNVTVFSPGSGYEKMPTITPATHRLTYAENALTSSGQFVAGEIITNNATPAVSATIVTYLRGKLTIAKSTGSFAVGNIITGSTTGAVATLTGAPELGANATFLGWSTTRLGAISGVEVTNFGTGFSTAPAATVPVKMLLTRKIISGVTQADITLATAFSTGDTIVGQTSSARGTVTAWDNARQTLTVKVTQGTFQRAETLQRGAGSNYAVLSEIAQGALSTTIGTVGTTAGQFNNDKGKISESLMRIQDSYYYQDFSYVVKVGAAIADWRAEIKKAVHPAGFAMFGEVSITNKVATLMTVPITGITSYTPALASLFEAVLTTVVGRRLGTNSDGTTLLGSTEIKGTSEYDWGTLKRGSHLGHEPQLFSTIESITRTGTTATVETKGPHGIQAGELVEISDVSSRPYDTTPTVRYNVAVTSITRSGSTATLTTPAAHNLTTGEKVTIFGASPTAYNGEKTINVTSATQFTFTIDSGTATPAKPGIAQVDDLPVEIVFTVVEYNGVHEITTAFTSTTFTATGNTTKDSKTVTNITTTSINEGALLGVTGSGIPADVTRFDSITSAGSSNNGTITLTHAATATASGVTLTFTVVSEDSFKITVSSRNTTPATVGNGKVKLISPFDNSTRDVTLRPLTTVEVYPLYGDWASAQRNRYGLGPRQSNAIKYMWATPPTEYTGTTSISTTENHQITLESGDGVITQEIEVLDRVDFTVTAATGKFIIDGVDKPALNLDGQRLYRFDLSSGTTSTHPFKISEVAESGNYTEQSGTPLEFSIEMESGSLTEYSILDSDLNRTILAEDGADLMVQIFDRVTTYGTQGSAGAYVEIFTENIGSNLYYYCGAHSGMGNILNTFARTGDYLINEAYQLGGEAAVENILLEDGGYILYETDTDPETQSVMVSEASTITYGSITEDLPSRLDDQMAYAYPNITRRESPESGTDNVDAGGAGVYDTTMNYTNIQIGDHESNVHNRISDFADVRIVDIIKSGREFLEIGSQTNKHEGDAEYEFTIMEDGSYVQMESGSAGIPTTSRKIWNVPPPSYIRLTTS